MLRDFTNFNIYLNELLNDVYPQPTDEWHTETAKKVIRRWFSVLQPCENVLDVGCGEGFCKPFFDELGIKWTGITLGEDYLKCEEQLYPVYSEDFSFLHFEDNSFDCVFSRHSLEHSPMPLLTLMEWHRVSRNWMCLIVPTPSYWGKIGQNHYSVLDLEVLLFYLERSGWQVIWKDFSDKEEYRLMCQKKSRVNWESIENHNAD